MTCSGTVTAPPAVLPLSLWGDLGWPRPGGAAAARHNHQRKPAGPTARAALRHESLPLPDWARSHMAPPYFPSPRSWQRASAGPRPTRMTRRAAGAPLGVGQVRGYCMRLTNPANRRPADLLKLSFSLRQSNSGDQGTLTVRCVCLSSGRPSPGSDAPFFGSPGRAWADRPRLPRSRVLISFPWNSPASAGVCGGQLEFQ